MGTGLEHLRRPTIVSVGWTKFSLKGTHKFKLDPGKRKVVMPLFVIQSGGCLLSSSLSALSGRLGACSLVAFAPELVQIKYEVLRNCI